MFNSSKIPLRGFVRRALAPVVRDRRANTAMIFALAFLPLLSVVGFAVDHNRHITAQNKVQTALDHAALATAKRMAEENMSDDEVDQAARDFFAAQFVATGGIAIDPIDAAEVGDELVLKATGTIDTSIMAVIGTKILPLKAETAVVYNIQQPVEVALVLDTSGSMSGSKLTALKNASRSLVDILLPNETDATKNDAAKVSVVPFNDYVKIDTAYKNASWMKDTDSYTRKWTSCSTNNAARRAAGCERKTVKCTKWRGSVEQGNRESYQGTCRRWVCPKGAEPEKTCRNRSEFRQWHGCVRSRSNPYNVNDSSYTTNKVPGIVAKNACSVTRTNELTNNHVSVDTVITNLKASGKTYIPTGLIWGLRSLSSTAPMTEGEDYAAFAAIQGRKAIMLMSDGANTVSPNNSGWHNRSNVTQANNYTLDICTEAKSLGIEVYTIAFDLDDEATKTMLKTCATDASYYYDADDATELDDAFSAIGRDLAELAISG
ncbi:MAG: hypothetical protein HRT81_02245 [Henriciella sp.]|nr:hypothetical protein [Henriciella sp.]